LKQSSRGMGITNVFNKLTIGEVNGSLRVHENADAPPP
jgi:hypothetical protein